MAKSPSNTFTNTCAWEVFFAPTNTAAPDADAAVSTVAAFVSAGIVQGDPTMGIDITKVTTKASNACGPVSEVITELVYSWALDQAQFGKPQFENFFGGGTWTASGAGEVWTPGALATVEKTVLFEMIGTNSQVIRLYHPRVSVSPSGDIAWGTDDLVTLPIDITALAPATGTQIEVYANPPLAAA